MPGCARIPHAGPLEPTQPSPRHFPAHLSCVPSRPWSRGVKHCLPASSFGAIEVARALMEMPPDRKRCASYLWPTTEEGEERILCSTYSSDTVAAWETHRRFTCSFPRGSLSVMTKIAASTLSWMSLKQLVAYRLGGRVLFCDM